MRVGIISPNLLLNLSPSTTNGWWVKNEWMIDSVGKKAAIFIR